MIKQSLNTVFYILLISTFSSCTVIEGIFKTGVGVGVFGVIIVIALVIFFIARLGKNK